MNVASVGQGGGAIEKKLEVGTGISEGGALALGFSFDLEVTAGGTLTGFSVGFGVENTVIVESGELTSYTGRIGSLPGDQLADNLYSFGLFSYTQTDEVSGKQFEVVNYWVE